MTPSATPNQIAPLVWAVALPADIPGPWRTTTAYLVGDPDAAWLIDPGGTEPEGAALIADLLRSAGVRQPKGVLLTHTHRDHVGALAAASAASAHPAPLVHPAGVARLGVAARPLAPGRRLMAGSLTIHAVATPGHASDHLAFWLPEAGVLIAGDLVSGRGAIWLGVPDGDVVAHLESLAVAAALAPRIVAPAHGDVRRDGSAVLAEARAHRLERERSILAALAAGATDVTALREALYPGLPEGGWTFAERTLLAHLRKLMHEGRVMHAGSDASGPYLASSGR